MNKEISSLDIAIIKYLLSCHDYCDSYDIARNVGINRRQIRSEISNVKKILSEFGITLESRRSKGYLIAERTRIPEFLQLIEQSEHSSLFETPVGRRGLLCEILIMNDDKWLKLDDIADMLYVSRSTINNDLITEEAQFRKHSVSLQTKSKYGIQLHGTEAHKRELLCDCIYNNFTIASQHYQFLDLFLNKGTDLETAVINTIRRHKIPMSDIAMIDFLMYLTIVCNRVSSGKTLEESPDISMLVNRREYDVASILAAHIGRYIGITLNEHELNMIMVKIIARESSSFGPAQEPTDESLRIVRECVDRFWTKKGIRFDKEDSEARLLRYIDVILLILRFGEKVRNPHFNTMKENYPLAYEMAEIVSDVIHDHTAKRLSRSHLAYLTVFFDTWIQNARNKPKRILLICGLGYGAAASVKAKLISAFGSQITVSGIHMYYEIPFLDLSEYDYIISTMPITRYLEIPVINISQFVTNDDIRNIKSSFSADYSLFHPELYFCESLYQNLGKAKDVESCARTITTQICLLYPRLKSSYVLNSICSKANKVSLLENGVATIRLKKPLVSSTFAAIATLAQPITYEDQEVSMIIVISAENEETDIYRAIREASRALFTNEIRELAQNNGTYSELIHLYIETNL